MARLLAAAAAALSLLAAPAAGQSDEGELHAHVPEGMFNAALGKPVVADSEFIDDRQGSSGSCPLVDGVMKCVASLAVDGFIGNEHRWLSCCSRPAEADSVHWLIVDLERSQWITAANVFAGFDATSDDGAISTDDTTYGLCDYDIQYYVRRVPACGLECPEQYEEPGWRSVVHVDAANEPTSMESHDQFAPTRGRYWRLKIDQSTCDTDNIARLYELQLLAPIPGRACEKSVHITGAGATRVNGYYYEDGTSNGATRYTKSGTSVSLLSWPDGNWYLSDLRGGAIGDRTPGDGDDVDYYIAASTGLVPPTTGWIIPSYSTPSQAPPRAGAGFATYPAPMVDVDQCDGEGENPQLVVGNPTSDRQTPDSAANIFFVDKNLIFPANGAIRAWDIYVGRPGEGFMQVWRPRTDGINGMPPNRDCNEQHNHGQWTATMFEDCQAATVWRLHCSMRFTATTHGAVHLDLGQEDRCAFRAGDAIGWAHAGQGVIDFDYGEGVPGTGEPPGTNGHVVNWHYSDANAFDGSNTLGQDITFEGGPGDHGRIYSVAATVRYNRQRETCAPVQSMKTCEELTAENGGQGWTVDIDGTGNRLGESEEESDRICGESQLPGTPGQNGCNTANFATAISMCFGLGARLCTLEEIMHDEVRNFD